jgi:hypothetical protein
MRKQLEDPAWERLRELPKLLQAAALQGEKRRPMGSANGTESVRGMRLRVYGSWPSRDSGAHPLRKPAMQEKQKQKGQGCSACKARGGCFRSTEKAQAGAVLQIL